MWLLKLPYRCHSVKATRNARVQLRYIRERAHFWFPGFAGGFYNSPPHVCPSFCNDFSSGLLTHHFFWFFAWSYDLIKGQPLCTYAKFSEKLTFITPWYAHIDEKMWVFRIILRTYLMDDPLTLKGDGALFWKKLVLPKLNGKCAIFGFGCKINTFKLFLVSVH